MKKLLVLGLLGVYLTLVYVSCANDVKADVVELRENMMLLPDDAQRAEMLSLLDQIEQKVTDLNNEKDQAVALKNQAENQVITLQSQVTALETTVNNQAETIRIKDESVDSLLQIEQALWERVLTDSLFYDTLQTRMENILAQ